MIGDTSAHGEGVLRDHLITHKYPIIEQKLVKRLKLNSGEHVPSSYYYYLETPLKPPHEGSNMKPPHEATL